MKDECKRICDELAERYPQLGACVPDILRAFDVLCDSFRNGGRLYLCGNGGSASDCEHVVGELLKSFRLVRPIDAETERALRACGAEGERLARELQGALPAVSLCGHPSFSTAFANDVHPDLIFAQAVHGLGRAGDVLLAFSTSGNSKNCVYAAVAARAKGMRVVFLGGAGGGKLKAHADVSVLVPETETFRVQELHLPVYHCLCAMLESYFWGAR